MNIVESATTEVLTVIDNCNAILSTGIQLYNASKASAELVWQVFLGRESVNGRGWRGLGRGSEGKRGKREYGRALAS